MNFKEKVFEIVTTIPSGKIATYGQVAAIAGSPRAARQVGWMLGLLGLEERKVPWWRVVNREGYLSIRGHEAFEKDIQKSLLIAEGIWVDDDYKLNLSDYIWEGNGVFR